MIFRFPATRRSVLAGRLVQLLNKLIENHYETSYSDLLWAFIPSDLFFYIVQSEKSGMGNKCRNRNMANDVVG